MLHVLRLPLSNVYLLTGARSVLIDTGRPADAPRIRAFLQEHGVKDLALIVVTHGHWDHAGAAVALRAATGAPIAVHRDDAELVRHGSNGVAKPTCLTAYFIRAFIDRDYPPFEPDVVFDADTDLAGFGVGARVVTTPGHTPGSISVLTQDREAIVGDLLTGGYLGGRLFPTRPGLHYFADDVEQVYRSVRKVMAMTPTVLHPGHGGPIDAHAVNNMHFPVVS